MSLIWLRSQMHLLECLVEVVIGLWPCTAAFLFFSPRDKLTLMLLKFCAVL